MISFRWRLLSNARVSSSVSQIQNDFFFGHMVLLFLSVANLPITVWWQIITKILIRYQTNQTSIALNPLVFGKSTFMVIEPYSVTRASNTVTEVRFLFVRSTTSYWRVKKAHNQSTKLGMIIWIIPFIGRRFKGIVIVMARCDDPMRGWWSVCMYGGLAISNWPTVSPAIFSIEWFVPTRSTFSLPKAFKPNLIVHSCSSKGNFLNYAHFKYYLIIQPTHLPLSIFFIPY